MQPPKGWKPPIPAREIDPLLEYWVYLANYIGTEVGVTLQVGGSLVQGTIIPVAKWLAGVSDGVRSATTSGDGRLTEVYADELDRLRQRVEHNIAEDSERREIEYNLATAEADEEGEDPDEVLPPERDLIRYVNLKDVVIKQGIAWHERPLYRIDLRSVDGWSLGVES